MPAISSEFQHCIGRGGRNSNAFLTKNNNAFIRRYFVVLYMCPKDFLELIVLKYTFFKMKNGTWNAMFQENVCSKCHKNAIRCQDSRSIIQSPEDKLLHILKSGKLTMFCTNRGINFSKGS